MQRNSNGDHLCDNHLQCISMTTTTAFGSQKSSTFLKYRSLFLVELMRTIIRIMKLKGFILVTKVTEMCKLFLNTPRYPNIGD